jgi:hypothetical protein
MTFSIKNALEILERTPSTLHALLDGLSPEWTESNEGPDTWSVYDIIGHLIHGEQTDWIVRAELILSDTADKTFQPFDRFAQFSVSDRKMLPELLYEFTFLRKKNLATLRSFDLTEENLEKRGVHPAFGEVTLAQLLATWTVHDLNHLSQIARVMAKQYKIEVGPWIEYLRILK